MTKFWAALEVVDASAVGLFHLITKHFDAMEVPFSKLFTYVSDGASVVAGKLGGLAGLLTQRINGYILAMHCVPPMPFVCQCRWPGWDSAGSLRPMGAQGTPRCPGTQRQPTDR